MARLDDVQRIQALQESGLLMRQGEDRLVSLCMAAVNTMSAAVSHINIITADAQIHVASWPPTKDDETPLTDAGCPRVVIAEHMLSISDARLDPEACHQPWVVEHGMRAYLGLPIRFKGQVLGSFCVIDDRVREWGVLDILTLEQLVLQAEQAIHTFV